MKLPQIDDYSRLFLEDVSMMDVRAPVEFAQGAFPGVKNLPLMNDDERQQVGLRYKQLGQDKAIALGHELVSGQVKEARVRAWEMFVKHNPDGVLYCFRGGLRSRISQQWIYDQTGIVFPRVRGGYKAMRRFLLDELDSSPEYVQPVILGGRTGIGKTLLLNDIKNKVDLEGIFHHRGSVFGKHPDPQPSQIDIENSLSIELFKLRNKNISHVLLEDEAGNIGSRRIPDNYFAKMKQSPMVMLEASLEERVANIFQEYIVESLSEYEHKFQEHGFESWANNLTNALARIQRRLGGVRYEKYKSLMDAAINKQKESGDDDAHKVWIEQLLTNYYDPMYDYQLGFKKDRLVFSGDEQSVKAFLLESYGIQ